MILDCAHPKDGARQNEGPLAIDEAAARARGDGFIWLGLHDPEPAELTDVAQRFDLPALAVVVPRRPPAPAAAQPARRGQAQRRVTPAGRAPARVMSVRQNDVVKLSSAWAAIITVPTLIASIYGMNFDHMPELHWTVGYPLALTMMVVAGLFLHRALRRAGWL